MKTILEHVRAQRAAAFAPAKTIIEAAEAENRDLTDDEHAQVLAIATELAPIDARLGELVDLETRNRVAAAETPAAAAVTVRSEPLTYDRHNRNQRSYFQDLALATLKSDPSARARLERHAQEMDVELVDRERRRNERADREMRALNGADAASPFERRTNPNRTDGQGGYFVPPLWLVDEFIPALRSGRVFADQCRKLTLPSGTDSINIPKLATGTATAIQTADAAPVTSTDLTDTSVSAGVKTIAGQQDVALQLLDQSPIAFDMVVLEDLAKDYNKRLDLQCLAGSGGSGQMTGVYPYTNWTSSDITYDDASPTVPELYAPLAQALSAIEQNRFDLEGVKVFMHSRRWFWTAAALDTTNRPLVLPATNGRYNSTVALGEAAVPPGYKGELALGFPVFTDPNITTADTHSSGSGQDVVIIGKMDDAWLFEGEVRTRVLPEVLSGTLQVRFQLYNYCAFLVRYGKAFSIIGGTGLAAPSGY